METRVKVTSFSWHSEGVGAKKRQVMHSAPGERESQGLEVLTCRWQRGKEGASTPVPTPFFLPGPERKQSRRARKKRHHLCRLQKQCQEGPQVPSANVP